MNCCKLSWLVFEVLLAYCGFSFIVRNIFHFYQFFHPLFTLNTTTWKRCHVRALKIRVIHIKFYNFGNVAPVTKISPRSLFSVRFMKRGLALAAEVSKVVFLLIVSDRLPKVEYLTEMILARFFRKILAEGYIANLLF